ncbi:MAG: PAS domain-containing protein [Candidatus Eremiobacteraeota bacterium]|nr:PAS domain-containing protein [Candidatus Eremiobacteraeota bacterium]MBC5801465.1 PAS domain-containing protein [Candidatus Eremiobacteraeota bacterium]MBC5820815.1 PAS domain-containing protein [Candidatus Eremiobacteraeota bacterium]
MHFAEALELSMTRPTYRVSPGMLSKLSGVSKATIVNWLGGRVAKPRSQDRLWRIADALRLNEVELRHLFLSAGHELPFKTEWVNVPFAGLPIGLYRTRPDGEILFANPALVNMLGYRSIEEYLRLNVAVDLYADPGERVAWQKRIAEAGALRDVTVAARRADGRTIMVRDSAVAIRNTADVVIGYEGIWDEATA